jgi:hypothetical protein
VPTRTPTRTESTNSRGVSPDRRSNGSDNRANGYGGHSASVSHAGWLEPRDMFHEDTQWEALPFERQMEASRPPGIDAVTCLMCGYLCSANMSSCPECDNAMGGDGGGDAPQLAPTPTDLAQFHSAQIVSSRSSLGSETSCDVNSEDTRCGCACLPACLPACACACELVYLALSLVGYNDGRACLHPYPDLRARDRAPPECLLRDASATSC